LILEIANNNAIKSDNITVGSLRFHINLTTKISTLESAKVTGGWDNTLKNFKSHVDKNYSPIKKKYHIQIVEVKAPTDKVNPGDTVIVELKLKNTGSNPIYSDSDGSLLASKKDGKASKFYLNEIWASQSQIPILVEGDIIKPEEEKSFQLKFRVPLYFGSQTESFLIKDFIGNKIEGTDFEISMNVANISQTVIEILNTETGYLNVRARDGGGDTTGRVSPGERYIQLKTGDYGYVQIDLGNGKSGWVSRKYVKKVN
jgi:ribosomal protein L19